MADRTEFEGVSTGLLSPVRPQGRSPSPRLQRRDFDDTNDGNGTFGGDCDGAGGMDSQPTASIDGGSMPTANLSTVVSSPRVSVMATGLFQELSTLVDAYGEGAVSGVIPIVVNMLETLDESIHDLSETQGVLDEITEDNEQLHAQFEKERKLRRDEQKMRLNAEDIVESERRESKEQLESLRENNRRVKKQLADAKDHMRKTDDRLDKLKTEQSELKNKYTRVNHALQLALRRDTKSLARRSSTVMESPTISEGEAVGDLIAQSLPPSAVGRRVSLPSSRTGSAEEGTSVSYMSAVATSHVLQRGQSARNFDSVTQEISETQAVKSSVVGQRQGILHAPVTSSPQRSGKEGRTLPMPVDDSGALLSSIRMEGKPGSSVPAVGDELPSTEAAKATAVSAVVTRSGDNVHASQITSQQLSTGSQMMAEGITSHHVHFPADVLPAGDDDTPHPLTASGELVLREEENIQRDEDDELEYMELTQAHMHAEDAPGNNQSFSQELLEQFVTEDGSILDVDPGADITVMDSENLVRQIHDLNKKSDELEKVIRQQEEKILELTTEQNRLQEDSQKVTELKEQRSDNLQKIATLEETVREKERYLEDAMQARSTSSEEPLFPGADENWKVNRDAGGRFSRVEMAKVVKERNEYKKKYYDIRDELEELKKQLEKPTEPPKKVKVSLWTMFAALFTGNRKRSDAKKSDALHMATLDVPSNQDNQEEEATPASISFDESRFEAFGWSLPKELQPSMSPPPPPDSEIDHDGGSHVSQDRSGLKSVPVLTHCSPVSGVEDQDRYFIPTSRVYSAAAVCCTPESNPSLNQSDMVCPSSLVWLCAGSSDLSRVDVIDANAPRDVVSSFPVGSSPILAIACVPGTLGDGGNVHIAASGAESRTLSRAELEKWRLQMSPAHSPTRDRLHTLRTEGDKLSVHSHHFASGSSSEKDPRSLPGSRVMSPQDEPDGANSDFVNISMDNDEWEKTPSVDEPDRARVQSPSDFTPSEVLNRPKFLHPTMWLGAEFGALYIHSAVSSWSSCLHAMKVEASVLSIVYTRQKVFVSMENGRMMAFHRDKDDIWDFENFDMIEICNYVVTEWQGTVPATSILAVDEALWCGVGNSVVVLNADTHEVIKSFTVHPSPRSIVTRLVRCGDGVWVCGRRDSTLRLFNAVTREHVQDLDLSQPLQSLLSMPGSKRKPSPHNLVRISSVLITNGCLWVGANNGAIICLPISSTRPKLPGEDTPKVVVSSNDDGSVAKTSVATGDDPLTADGEECDGRQQPATVVVQTEDGSEQYQLPYCDAEAARLSFHGHLHHVDVLLSAPGAMSTRSTNGSAKPEVSSSLTFVISTGAGYVDLRLGSNATRTGNNESERNHVIVWQVSKQD